MRNDFLKQLAVIFICAPEEIVETVRSKIDDSSCDITNSDKLYPEDSDLLDSCNSITSHIFDL